MKADDFFVQTIKNFYAVQPHEDIITWAEKNIDFSDDISAERSRIDFAMSPFLVEPLRMWDFSGKIREVTVCGIEQHGKTLLEVIGVLYNFIDHPCSNLCVYPSDEDAADINLTKYEPLVKHLAILKPYTAKKDRYVFGAATMFFQGAGKKIMSKSCQIVVLDEEDHFPVVGTLDAGEDARKRTRSYSESILYRVCTPTTIQGPIWKSFLAGSQGYWTLRCLHCGALTMRSSDFSNFQYESTFDEDSGTYSVVPGSERMICPVCHHEHVEEDKKEMNLSGEYVHKFNERKELHPSFQFGALCSQMPYMSWTRIANKILECGKRSDIKAHFELDNSYKGLPYQERKITAEDVENLKTHFYHDPPPPEKIELVFAVSDTQDTFSPTGIFALDCCDNLYLLRYENPKYLWLSQDEKELLERQMDQKILTVEELIDEPVRIGSEKIVPMFHVIDYRGHRQREILEYAKSHRKVFMYAGVGMRQVEAYKNSSTHPRMLIVNAKYYQRTLLWQLYKQRDKSQNFLWLPDHLDPEYQKQISCVQPDKKRKSGHLFENWEPENDAVHDTFDVLKMAYFAVDYAIAKFDLSRFRIGKSPALVRRWRKK